MVLRVVWGTGTGPTGLAAYDAALCDAGVGDHNLVRLSSVLPADVPLEQVGTAPDLGPVGSELRVVEASATAAPGGAAAAALGWVRRDDGSGLFYEEGAVDGPGAIEGSDGPPHPDGGAVPSLTGGRGDVQPVERTVADRVREGLAAGVAKRGWTVGDPAVVSRSIAADGDAHAACVVLATYGRATAIGRD